MNKKTIIIAGIIVFVLIVVGVLVGKNSSGLTQITPTPFPTLAPPAPTGVFPQPTGAVFSFATAPSLPASLPAYSYQPMTLSAIESLSAKTAVSLDLSATPSALTRGGSYTKTWSRGNDANLIVTQTNDLITITYHQIKSTTSPGTFTPDVAVQQFILSLVPAAQGINVRPAGTSSGPFDGLLVLDTPLPKSYMNYFYSYVTSGAPILTTGLSLAPISVIADSGGIVRSASIIPPPTLTTQGGAVNIISNEQILASLSGGRGLLLDVHAPQAPEQGVIPTFTKFIITDVKLVYAPKDSQLLPALYLTGSGTTASGQKQDATIFLWAYAEGFL